MRRLMALVLAGWVVAALGCGDGAQKGVNKDKDKPRPADKEPEKAK